MSRDPKPGDLLDGRYRLGGEIGRGGRGVVFRAIDEASGAPVALKILHRPSKGDPAEAARLSQETQALHSLCGPSVVYVHDVLLNPSGFVFLVMELLDGQTLAQHLTDLEDFGDRMSSYNVLAVMDPIARALHAAHAKGLVHCDVTPANIFLVDPDVGGGVRLMDFGLAKPSASGRLGESAPVGSSPSYIAPEIGRGESYDHRADVYSLGAVIFRALAGRPPFEAGSAPDLLSMTTSAPRPRLTPLRPELSGDIDSWVERVLAVEPAARYPYVPTMWNDLISIVMRGSSPSAERARATFRLPA